MIAHIIEIPHPRLKQQLPVAFQLYRPPEITLRLRITGHARTAADNIQVGNGPFPVTRRRFHLRPQQQDIRQADQDIVR